MIEKINCWIFYYNSCIHESAPSVMSYHKTREGAEKAMNIDKELEKKKFDDMYKENKFNFYTPMFGEHEEWFVEEAVIEIKD